MFRRSGFVAVAAALPLIAPSVEARSRTAQTLTVVDRTLRCTAARETPLDVREISVTASPRTESREGSRWNSPASASVGTGNRPSFPLVAVSTGIGAGAAYARHAGVWVNTRRCRRVRTTIPLAPGRLPGPPLAFGGGHECRGVGRRILVRVRARFTAPTRWVRNDFRSPDYPVERGMKTNGKISEASVAVRTERARRPLSFVALDGAKGTMRFYVAAACG